MESWNKFNIDNLIVKKIPEILHCMRRRINVLIFFYLFSWNLIVDLRANRGHKHKFSENASFFSVLKSAI